LSSNRTPDTKEEIAKMCNERTWTPVIVPPRKPWDEQTERIYDPSIYAPLDAPEKDNLARAIVRPSRFVILVVPKNIITGEYDPTWAHLLQHDDGSNRTVVFNTHEEAFNFALKYIDDPWQTVEL